MADIEVSVFRKGRHIKTVSRPKRVLNGVTAVIYKKRTYPLKRGNRIDLDKPYLADLHSSREQDAMTLSKPRIVPVPAPVSPKLKPTIAFAPALVSPKPELRIAPAPTPVSPKPKPKIALAPIPDLGKRRDLPVDWDPEQRAVIDLPRDARVLVGAGPGMGKTAVACARVAKLVSDGVEPANIWLVSFTRTAVREIRNRIAALVATEDRAAAVRITTLDSKAWHLAQGFESERDQKIFQGYDDTIKHLLKLLEEGSEELQEYLESIEHFIVDEAQDFVGVRSDLVFELIRRLPASCGVTVFADDAQAIYGWSAEARGESRDGEENLSRRLRASKGVRVRAMELRTIHRTDSAGLKKIFELTRAKVLQPTEDPTAKILEIRADIEQFAGATIGSSIQQGIAGQDNILLLFRRRAEVLIASSILLSEDIPHRIRMSGAPVCVAPWVGITLRDFTDRHLTRDRFAQIWAERMPTTTNSQLNLERAWAELHSAAGDHGGRIEIRRLRKKLGASNPPLGFCNPELGTGGPILGTIHASKGREADIVHLMLPSNAGSHNNDEEGRVLFVGATRARHSLRIGMVHDSSGANLKGTAGRAFRNANRGEGTRAHVEFGRANDLDEVSCVSSSSPLDADEIEKVQTTLAQLGNSILPVKAICQRQPDKSFQWHFRMEQGAEPIYLGLLGGGLVNDLFDVGKEVRSWQSWRPKLKPHMSIDGLYVIGVRTIVVPADDSEVESLAEPYSQSGIFLCPIIYGFPSVHYNSYS